MNVSQKKQSNAFTLGTASPRHGSCEVHKYHVGSTARDIAAYLSIWHRDACTDRQTDRQAGKKTSRHTYIHTYRQTDDSPCISWESEALESAGSRSILGLLGPR